VFLSLSFFTFFSLRIVETTQQSTKKKKKKMAKSKSPSKRKPTYAQQLQAQQQLQQAQQQQQQAQQFQQQAQQHQPEAPSGPWALGFGILIGVVICYLWLCGMSTSCVFAPTSTGSTTTNPEAAAASPYYN
jgi:thiol:disulfide interchange protein